MSKRGYSVIIFAPNDMGDLAEVTHFNERNYDSAQTIFNHQYKQLKWSLQHRVNMGIKKDAAVVVQLFDKTEGYELQEAIITS